MRHLKKYPRRRICDSNCLGGESTHAGFQSHTGDSQVGAAFGKTPKDDICSAVCAVEDDSGGIRRISANGQQLRCGCWWKIEGLHLVAAIGNLNCEACEQQLCGSPLVRKFMRSKGVLADRGARTDTANADSRGLHHHSPGQTLNQV